MTYLFGFTIILLFSFVLMVIADYIAFIPVMWKSDYPVTEFKRAYNLPKRFPRKRIFSRVFILEKLALYFTVVASVMFFGMQFQFFGDNTYAKSITSTKELLILEFISFGSFYIVPFLLWVSYKKISRNGPKS